MENKYVNIHTNRVISESEYDSMNYFEKRTYRRVTSSETLNDTGDFLLSAAVGAATDSALLGGIVGGDMLGGIVGDILDGDLFD
jgi:hypothetical protein